MKSQTQKQQPISRRTQTFKTQVKGGDGKVYESKETLPIRVYGRLD